ncbi:hypothetical protein SAY86_015089 [Trapa natans]|uniref:Uncharacterized protein n=1 Tax=Trapa natans TaxID=22666 RepID=A0AAN7KLB9_TRANT|nr:hypothetical protein SAY86_015089 [Trapa natans]
MNQLVRDRQNANARNNICSSDLDDLPLFERRNMLLEAKLQSCPNDITCNTALGEAIEESSIITDAIVLKHKHNHIDLQDACITKKYDPKFSDNGDISELFDYGNIKVEPYDGNHFPSHQRTALPGMNDVSTKKNDKVLDAGGWSEQLDHVPLINRREILLLRKKLLYMDHTYIKMAQGYKGPSVIHRTISIKDDGGHRDYLGIGEDLAHLIGGRANEVIQPISENCSTGNELNGAGERHRPDTCGTPGFGIQKSNFVSLPCKNNYCSIVHGLMNGNVTESARICANIEAQANEAISLSKRKSSKLKRYNRSDHVLLGKRSCPDSTLQTIVNVKVENSDNTDVLDSRCMSLGKFALNPSSVKREGVVENLVFDDKLDHMLLRERMDMLPMHANSCSDRDWLPRTLPASEMTHTVLQSVKPIRIKHPGKRRKTVTDSIETALEEDAPGLLRVLLDNGVSADEIKLYGDVEDDEPLYSFAELEDVISLVFSQRQTFLKFGPLKNRKDTKTTYCLACLFSLVEQTRYLQFRKWPVEWGWCRDLQSFIFVFERHRRIVLERPEYGYATYFFELVDSMPIVWQIKRLVIVMKLTSSSRISLIENKALQVGQDLTDKEARVLMEYGWRPNSGLGTMLNYCDRVVHDRKNEIENDTSEWRAKIGKLLMDGYIGGTIKSCSTAELIAGGNAKIKLEL